MKGTSPILAAAVHRNRRGLLGLSAIENACLPSCSSDICCCCAWLVDVRLLGLNATQEKGYLPRRSNTLERYVFRTLRV